MKELTKEMLADLLNGCEAMSECDLMKCRHVPTQEDAENSNLVVLFGRCDDLIVVRGAVYNELYISEGEQLALVLAGEKIDDDEDVMNTDIPGVFQLSDDYIHDGNPRLITVRCSNGENELVAWEFSTNMPHADFMLYLDGRPFCRGIVIDLDEIEPIKWPVTETIEERASEAWKGYQCWEDSPHRDCFIDGFIEGAKSEREELIRWHDTKKELPEMDVEVQVMPHADSNIYDVMRYDRYGWWQQAPGGGWCAATNAPARWRYIHTSMSYEAKARTE